MGLFHSRRRQVYPTRGEGGLELEWIGNARVGEKLGEGVSCVVHAARFEDADVALKLYKAGSIERHARLLGGELVEFEYRRNRAFFEAPGLGRYVARPLAYLSTAGVAAMVQERLDGRNFSALFSDWFCRPLAFCLTCLMSRASFARSENFCLKRERFCQPCDTSPI